MNKPLPAWLWLLPLAGIVAWATLPTRRHPAQSGGMSTLTKAKKPTRKPAVKPGTERKSVPAWIGSARGKVAIKPGVDLTKPTLPPGKYL